MNRSAKAEPEPQAGDLCGRIGVVIITMDRCDELLVALERLHQLPEQPRVVVVDNGSHDDTVPRIRVEAPWVELIDLDRNLGAAGRNIGAEVLATEYVAFCDDDMAWEPGSLARAVELLDAYPGAGLLAARILVGPDDREDPVCRLMAEAAIVSDRPTPGPLILGFLAGASVVRRGAFSAVGGFDARFGVGGEEELVAYDLAAAGWALTYVDDLVVRHHPSRNRDHETRSVSEIRNRLWVEWMRRPLRHAIEATWRVARQAGADRVCRRALAEAIHGVPWVARRRRPLPQPLEAQLAHLEALPA